MNKYYKHFYIKNKCIANSTLMNTWGDPERFPGLSLGVVHFSFLWTLSHLDSQSPQFGESMSPSAFSLFVPWPRNSLEGMK